MTRDAHIGTSRSGQSSGDPGGQADFLRVPHANFTFFRVPDDCELEDEQLLFLSDIMPTAYWSVDNAGVKPDNTVVVLGCGPVGLPAQKFAWMKGAKRVITVDYIGYRLDHAKRTNKVGILDFTKFDNVEEHIKDITGGGADIIAPRLHHSRRQKGLCDVSTMPRSRSQPSTRDREQWRQACHLVSH